jgi:uncharacterized protein
VNRSNGREKSLIIRISGLSNGLHEYHFSTDPGEIGLKPNFSNAIQADIKLDKSARQLYLKAEISTSGFFDCDRCLEQFELPVVTRYTAIYLYSEADMGKYPPEEIEVISPETTSIDLSEDVCEMILLSVPLKLLCKEECRGLCPKCGVNRNRTGCDCEAEVDTSRWGELKKLLNR